MTTEGAWFWIKINQMELSKQICQNKSDFETDFAFNRLYDVFLFQFFSFFLFSKFAKSLMI